MELRKQKAAESLPLRIRRPSVSARPSTISETSLYPQTSVRSIIKFGELRDKSVLDVGPGDLSLEYINPNFPNHLPTSNFIRTEAESYIGFDISKANIERSQRAHPCDTFIQGNVLNGLPFRDRSRDIVILSGILPTLGLGYEVALRESARVAAEGVILTALHPDWILTKAGKKESIPNGLLVTEPNGMVKIGLYPEHLERFMAERGFTEQDTVVLTREQHLEQAYGIRSEHEEVANRDVKMEILLRAFRK